MVRFLIEDRKMIMIDGKSMVILGGILTLSSLHEKSGEFYSSKCRDSSLGY
jgi:hypothetical protein